MMSSIKLNDKTICTQYGGNQQSMSVTCQMEDEDILTVSIDGNGHTNNIIVLLEKLGLSEAVMTFTATAGGIYSVQANYLFGIQAHKVG